MALPDAAEVQAAAVIEPDPDVVLAIDDLRTHFFTEDGVVKAVDGVSLAARRGRTLCVVGESGCGKSVTARSILNLVDEPGRIVTGTIRWRPRAGAEPVDLAALDPRGEAMRRVRGGQIGMVFQEPMASLSPMYTIGEHLVEAIRMHLPLSAREARDKAVDELTRVGFPQPTRRLDSYPFQLSGGMNQRAMIALALSCSPTLLIADEPTTALDVTTQAQILDLLAGLQAATDMAMMFITHDLGVVAEIADDVSVMYLGSVVERGSVTDVFEQPAHPYTRALLESVPVMGGSRGQTLAAIAGMVPHPGQRPTGCTFHPRCPSAMPGLCDTTPPAEHVLGAGRTASCHLHDPDLEPWARDAAAQEAVAVDVSVRKADVPTVGVEPASTAAAGERRVPLLAIHELSMDFPITRGFLNRTVGVVRAVRDVSLSILPGETLGLVGESGCGKTTLGRCVVRALEPTAGRIEYGAEDGTVTDVATLSGASLRPYRAEMRMIFQDPFSSLNPRKTLQQIIAEPLLRTRGHDRADSSMQDRVAAMLRRVGLRPEYMRRYPHAFSGGERQRVSIARALITEPRLVVADEAVSALDVSVRAQILNLLRDLQDEFDLTYLFISHDLSVVEHVSDRVAVMYLGRIVEEAAAGELFDAPRHPYTEALLSAVPVPDPRKRGAGHRIRLPGDPPEATDAPPGCPFHPRCPHRRELLCDTDFPVLGEVTPDHVSACHYAAELTLSGVAREGWPPEERRGRPDDPGTGA